MQTPGLPRTLYFHQSPLVIEVQDWTKELASSVLEMPLETEINAAHVYKKNKYNMPAHIYLYTRTHTRTCVHTHTHTHTQHTTWITKSNTVTSIVKRTVDFKPTGTKMLTALLHREVLLPSSWAQKLSQKLQRIRSLNLQETWSPFLPPYQLTLFRSTVSRCKPPSSKKASLTYNLEMLSHQKRPFNSCN